MVTGKLDVREAAAGLPEKIEDSTTEDEPDEVLGDEEEEAEALADEPEEVEA